MIGIDEIRAVVAQALGVGVDAVDDHTDMISLGIDSIRMMKIAGAWRKQGYEVNFAQLASRPSVAGWAELLGGSPSDPGVEPASATGSVVEQATHAAKDVVEQATHAAKDEAGGSFPLAPMQHAYWIGRQTGQQLGGVAAHLYVEFDGSGVDPDTLRRAVTRLVEVHPTLRSQVLADGTQRIMPRPPADVFVVSDLRDLADDAACASVESLRDRMTHQLLPVQDGQMLAVVLSLLPDGRTRLHIDVDMLAADAVSYRLVMKDLATLYVGGEVEPAGLTYRDYLERIASQPESRHEIDREWWAARLNDLPAAPSLPQRAPSRQARPERVVRCHHWVGPAAKSRVFASSRRRGLTPAMVLASVFADIVGRWSTDRRFLLNLPLFQREPITPAVERVVGDFSSSILLDVDTTAVASVTDRARALQTTMHANGSHAAYGALEVLRDLGRLRGEQVLAPVVYTSAINLGELFDPAVTGVFGDPGWIVSQGPQVLLDAQVTEVDEGLLLNWDVRIDHFPDGVIDAMFGEYTAAIDRIAGVGSGWDGSGWDESAWDGPGWDGSGRDESAWDESAWDSVTVPELPPEQRRVRDEINATATPLSGRTLHEGFFAYARSSPEEVALMWGGDGRLTYGELARHALAVGGALRDLGVVEGDSVGVLLPKGPEQVVATLGVLALGATYVPISVDQPTRRRARILAGADVSAVISTGDAVTGELRAPVVSVPHLDPTGVSEPPAPVPSAPLAQAHVPDPESVAYVLFTSGSTGEPKGVEVPHRAAMNTIDDINRRFGIGASDRSIMVAAYEFDISVYDIFGPLSVGGAIIAVDAGDRGDPVRWAELMRRHGASVLTLVPSALDMLLAVCEAAADPSGSVIGTSLRAVLIGGDRVGVDLPRRLRAVAPDARFAGLGGATETAIHHTVCEVGDAPDDWSAVPFGTPLSNVRCRVVDATGDDCPDWVVGELWVGGAGVARGYRGQPELTAERFVRVDGERWYRTGDLTRWRPDGAIEFVGRADHQVKLRGYRVELGEVESALRSIDGVLDALALIDADRAAPQLIAAVRVDTSALSPARAKAVVHEALAASVPAYMLPDHLVILDRFPLTQNGKVDRAGIVGALEHTAAGDLDEQARTALETALVDIVGSVVDDVTVTADFFALGGDSVLATTAMVRVREWLDCPDAGVADLFASRNVRALAERLTGSESEPGRLEQVAQVYLEVMAMDASELSEVIS